MNVEKTWEAIYQLWKPDPVDSSRGGWAKYPEVERPGVFSTAMGLLIWRYLSAWRMPHPELRDKAFQYLRACQRADGGWTNSRRDISMTHMTCAVLQAFLEYGMQNEEVVDNGIKWILGMQDKTSGSWPIVCEGPPSVLATAYALRVLTRADVTKTSSAVLDAYRWLFHTWQETGWGHKECSRVTLWHTAHALIALIEAATVLQTQYNKQKMISTVASLEQGLTGPESAHEMLFADEVGQGEFHSFWVRPLIISALVTANMFPLSESALSALTEIMNTQVPSSSMWPDPENEKRYPIWAMHDAIACWHMLLVRRRVGGMEASGERTLYAKQSDVVPCGATGKSVFIGHGRSPLWRELKDFLQDRLGLRWDEFNREVVAGFTTFERISEMLDSALFAFLIMTSEDEHADSSVHARQNVVHEVGLFQGRLGSRRAIILLEEGCSEFSNIVGLSQIRFPKGHISAVFEDIRRVLERERMAT